LDGKERICRICSRSFVPRAERSKAARSNECDECIEAKAVPKYLQNYHDENIAEFIDIARSILEKSGFSGTPEQWEAEIRRLVNEYDSKDSLLGKIIRKRNRR
jgi:hypothetical protein